ncbi:MAG: WG repeat-containing protein [Bacteroidales bacterium]|nr:WG repeat-containing protein [Bacteroidales bacterium]
MNGKVSILNVTNIPEAKGFVIETTGDNAKECIDKILDYVYDCHGSFKDGYAQVKSGNRYGIVNLLLKPVVPTEYEQISSISEKCAVLRKNGKEFLCVLEGSAYTYKIFENEPFDIMGTVTNGMSVVMRNEKYGLVNVMSSSLVLPCEYDEIKMFALNRPITAVRKENKWAIVGKDGKILTDFVFEKV